MTLEKAYLDSNNNYLAANIAYYDRNDVWSELTQGERMRIEGTISMVPADVRTLLNVGSGDGRVTNSLADRVDVHCVDVCESALENCKGTKTVCSIEALPFAEKIFDLVLATEVIEHLPEQLYSLALLEMERVSRKYILITVPNNELLEMHRTRCQSCSTTYHLWNHLRTFSRDGLNHLFNNFALKQVLEFGETLPVGYRFFYTILNRVGNSWPFSESAICPCCGHMNLNSDRENLFGKVWKRVVWRMYEHPIRVRKAFLGVLFERI